MLFQFPDARYHGLNRIAFAPLDARINLTKSFLIRDRTDVRKPVQNQRTKSVLRSHRDRTDVRKLAYKYRTNGVQISYKYRTDITHTKSKK